MTSPRWLSFLSVTFLALSSLAATGCSGDAPPGDDDGDDDETSFSEAETSALTKSEITDWLANKWDTGGYDVKGQPGFKMLHMHDDYTYEYERVRCAPGVVEPCPVEKDEGPGRHFGVYHYPNHPERGHMVVFFHGAKAHLVINYKFTPTNDCGQRMYVARHVDFMRPGEAPWQTLYWNSCN